LLPPANPGYPSKLALENGINANLLFKWRQQWREESCYYLL
jgi:transposase-like protein